MSDIADDSLFSINIEKQSWPEGAKVYEQRMQCLCHGTKLVMISPEPLKDESIPAIKVILSNEMEKAHETEAL